MQRITGRRILAAVSLSLAALPPAIYLFGWIGVGAVLSVWMILGLTELAAFAANEMDRRGRRGWIYGVLILCFPPWGIAIWLLLRQDTRDIERGVE
jgi:anti-sigma factor RsiW